MGQVVSDQPTDIVPFRECDNQDDPDQRRDESAQTAQDALVCDMAHVPVQQEGDDLDSAAGNAQDQAVPGAIPKAVDLTTSQSWLTTAQEKQNLTVERTSWLKKLVIPPFGISAMSA